MKISKHGTLELTKEQLIQILTDSPVVSFSVSLTVEEQTTFNIFRENRESRLSRVEGITDRKIVMGIECLLSSLVVTEKGYVLNGVEISERWVNEY